MNSDRRSASIARNRATVNGSRELGQHALDARQHAFPIANFRLPKKPRCRIPRAVGTIEHPTKIRHSRKQNPDPLPHRAGQMSHRRIDADDEIEQRDNGGRIGEVGKLAEQQPMAANEEIFSRMNQLLSAQDREGLVQLDDQGGIAWLKAGTKIRVIGLASSGGLEVRALTGKMKGSSGWIVTDHPF